MAKKTFNEKLRDSKNMPMISELTDPKAITQYGGTKLLIAPPLADKPNFEMLRVTGMAEIVKDEELENRLKQQRPWLWGNIQQANVDTEVVIFRIVNGTAYIWNMLCNVKEDEAPRVKF